MALRRELIRVSGPDALGYLQGQLAADLLAGPGSRWSLLLEPNGRVVALLLVSVGLSDATLSVEAGQAAAVVQRLERFMLRTDAQIDVKPVSVERRRLEGAPPSGAWVHEWAGSTLVDELVADGSPDERDALLRVELGLPTNGVDLDGDLFANALGPRRLGSSCSSTKGCYVGQELVARTTSRGTPAPELLVRLRGRGSHPSTPAVLRAADGEVVGQATTTVDGPAGWVGLGRARRSAIGLEVTCEGQAVELVPLD